MTVNLAMLVLLEAKPGKATNWPRFWNAGAR